MSWREKFGWKEKPPQWPDNIVASKGTQLLSEAEYERRMEALFLLLESNSARHSVNSYYEDLVKAASFDEINRMLDRREATGAAQRDAISPEEHVKNAMGHYVRYASSTQGTRHKTIWDEVSVGMNLGKTVEDIKSLMRGQQPDAAKAPGAARL